MGFKKIGIILVLILVCFFAGGAFAAATAITANDITTADGNYKAGAVIDVNLTFDNAVTIYGSTPFIGLNTTPARNAVYFDGNQTTKLLFRYTVSAGDNVADLGATSVNALDLNGSTIKNEITDANIILLDVLTLGSAVFIDTTAPVTTASGNTYLTWTKTNQTVTLSCADVTGSGCKDVNFMIDNNGTWIDVVASLNSIPLLFSTDLNHSIQYYATDGAGNLETLKTVYAAVDKTVPTTPVITSPTVADPWLAGNQIVTVTSSDANSGIRTIEIFVDGNRIDTNATSSPASSTWNTATVADGNHIINARATDYAYNDANSAALVVIVDNNVPTYNMVDRNNHWMSADFNITIKDVNFGWSQINAAASYYTIDDAQTAFTGGKAVLISDYDYNLNIPITTDGNHVVNVRMIDNSGNVTDINGIQAKLDKAAPTITVGSLTLGVGYATVPITLNEPGSCRYKAGIVADFATSATYTQSNYSWADLSNDVNLVDLGAGSYDYVFACRDQNDTEASSSVIHFTISGAGTGGASTGGGTSSGGSTTTSSEGTVTVSESSDSFTPTASEVTDALSALKGDDGLPLYTASEVAAMAASSQDYTFTKTLKVEEVTSSNGTKSYNSTFSISVKNNNSTDMQNVLVVETIPKAVAQAITASQIDSALQFRILAADPVVQFTVPLIKAGQSYSVGYVLNTTAKPGTASLSAPTIGGEQVVVPVVTPPVTTPPADKNQPATTPPVVETPIAGAGMDWTMPIVVIIVIIVIVVIAAVSMGKGKKGKLSK
ncbi:Uncharacterised protein [uncultured archaeon]|nr:Uncharacterised protein [uncultured archaeon]